MADIVFYGDAQQSYARKLKDMGDGTYALVLYRANSTVGGSDKIINGPSERAYARKLHDNGDGTFALVRVGG